MSEPTEVQRLAEAIYTAGNISGVPWQQASVWARGKAERQALAVLDVLDAALAAERAKARAPFLALADSIEGPAAGDTESDWEAGNRDAMNRIAGLIRRAAEDPS